jgi:hypothetical protein
MACLMLFSCKTIYRQNLAQVPVFREAKSAQADILLGSNGGELQVGYAVSDNWAIVASGVYDLSQASVMDSIYGVKDGNSNYSNFSGELGLGYYKWLSKDSLFCMSLFGGGGFGKTAGFSDLWYTPDFVSYNANYYKIFWQPTFTYSKGGVDFSLASRFRFLSYSKLSTSRGDKFKAGVDTYVEPVASLKVGGEQLKIHFQVGASIPFQQQVSYTASPLLFALGFHLNFTKQSNEDHYYE